MKKTPIVFYAILILTFSIFLNSSAQNALGSFRSKKSGTWTSSSIWQYRTTLGWIDTTLIPDTFSVVSIQNGHSLTLSSNVGCGDLHLNNAGVLICGSYQLSISGKIRCYSGISDTTINDAIYSNATNPSAGNITCTTGRIKFIGASRSLTNIGEWGANGLTSSAVVEFALDSGQTGNLNTSFKAFNILISSGIINMGTNRLAPDKGSIGQGDLTISAGATLQSAASASGTPVISRTTSSASGRSGNFILNGVLKLLGNSPYLEFSNVQINAGSTIVYAGSNQNWINCSYTGSANFSNYANITLQGTSAVKTTIPSLAIQINGTMLIQGSAILALGNAGSVSYSPSSTLEYNGSVQQNTGTSPAEWPVVNGPKNLTINNINGLILSTQRTITGVMKLNNGILFTTTSNLLTLDTNATVMYASNISFVNGPIKKNGKNAFVFPVGKVGIGLQQIMISASDSVSNSFTAEYIRSSPYQLGYKVAGMLTKVSACEYWSLVQNTGSSKIYIALYGNVNSGCSPSSGASYFTGAGANLTDLKVARFNNNNATWENCGGSTLGSSPDIITSSDSINLYGVFTFGTTNSNPLPVRLINFDASYYETSVKLTWTTATEHNSHCFNIESSEDGKNFVFIGDVKSKGNSIETIEYSFIDSSLFSKIRKSRYYRLKQIDEDGTFEYSKVIKLENSVLPATELFISNPFNNHILIVIPLQRSILLDYELFNLNGNLISTKQFLGVKGNNKLKIETPLIPSGTYLFVLKSEGYVISKKILLKPIDP